MIICFSFIINIVLNQSAVEKTATYDTPTEAHLDLIGKIISDCFKFIE